MSLNSQDDQAEKTKAIPQQAKASLPMSDQSMATENAKEKARKEKKRRGHQGQ